MSEARAEFAREELLCEAMAALTKDGGSEVVAYGDAKTVLDAFLSQPDDLLAVLVEEGALIKERSGYLVYGTVEDAWPSYRRTEGDTR